MVSLLKHKKKNLNSDENNGLNYAVAISGRSTWKNPGFQSAT